AERAECPPPPAHLDARAPVELEGLERVRVEAVGVGDRHRNAVARRAEAPWVPVERRAARRQLLPGPLEAEREEVVREAAALVAPPAELPRVGEERLPAPRERGVELAVTSPPELAPVGDPRVGDRRGARHLAGRAPDRGR